MKLREYQELASDFIYENDRTLILAKVGAGKTVIALTAVRDTLRDHVVRRWLIVAPKRVAEHTWPTEIAKWVPTLRFAVAVGSPAKRKAAIESQADVVITNYDNLQWFADNYPKHNFDGVVFDELTRMKNPSGKRFKAFFDVMENVKMRVGLTGSFTSNGLEDVFGQVKIIDVSALGRSKGAFLQQYFWSADPKLGQWIPRPQALENIMARIKPITYLLESKEYADTLPPLHHIELRCDMDMTQYNKMKRDFVLELGNDEMAIAVNAAVVSQKLRQLSSGFIYQTSTTASATPGKFDTVQTAHWFSHHKFDMLDDLLTENHHEPTLVFYQYKEELAELLRRFPYAQTLDDKDAIPRWNRGQIRLLLAHPDSAQYGLNLQEGGSAVVFLSLPWSLLNFEQAVGRLHRSGQRHEVRCYIMLTNKTIDEVVWQALHDKRTLSEIAVEALKNV